MHCGIVDKYNLLEVVGRSDKARIYRSIDIDSGLEVAIKVSLASRDESQRADAIDDWRNEGGLIGRINHESIAKTHDAFVMKKEKPTDTSLKIQLQNKRVPVHSIDIKIEPGDTMYLVRDFIDGSKLDDYMAQHREKEPKFEIHALDLMMQICGAISYCHTHNIYHNDLKPKNILVTSQRKIKIIDFGLSKYPKSNESDGIKRGSPPYAPPESYQDNSELTPASEVYSLGVVFYHMLTGKDMPSADERMEHKGKFQSELDELENRCNWSKELWNIIRKATQIKPEDRYSGVDSMKETLERLKAKEYRPLSGLEKKVGSILKSAFTAISQLYYGQS